MKKLFVLIAVLFAFGLWADVPNRIAFQSILRDANGGLMKNSTVELRISILEGSVDGECVYSEIHNLTTNANGLASLYIGAGDSEDDFTQVQWQNIDGYVKVEVKFDTSSEDYSLSYISKLVSVPYALQSALSEGVNGEDVLVDYKTLTLSDGSSPALYINENNQMLFFTKEADPTRPDLRKDIQLAPDVRLWGYSSEYHLDKSGVINLQAVDSASKPAIVWYNPEGVRKAAIVGHEYSGGHNKRHNHWSIETTTESGELFTRMEFPFDSSVCQIETHSADFTVGDKGVLRATGKVFAYNPCPVGFGDKDWEKDGLEGYAKWEFYRESNTAEMLIHQAGGNKAARLTLLSGDSRWEVENEGNLKINSGTKQRVIVKTDGNVGIGVDDPQYRLEVNGDVNVATGYSYLSSGADYAEYFQTNEVLKDGDVVGINMENGYVRKYVSGDELLGIVSAAPAYVGNNAPGRDKDSNYVLVGIKGQLSVNVEQVDIRGRRVFTPDGQSIGVLLANNKVYLKF